MLLYHVGVVVVVVAVAVVVVADVVVVVPVVVDDGEEAAVDAEAEELGQHSGAVVAEIKKNLFYYCMFF